MGYNLYESARKLRSPLKKNIQKFSLKGSQHTLSNNKNNTGLSWVLGAGIVGADIGTSVFYSTGLLFGYVGYLSPFFILLICLMMWAFKKTYEGGTGLKSS